MKNKKISRLFYFISFLLLTVFSFGQDSEKVAEHATRKSPTILDFLTKADFITKYYFMLVIGIIVLLLFLTRKMSGKIRTSVYIFSLFLFGIAGNIQIKPFSFFSMHPSPMCVTKAMLYGFAIPFAITLGVIFLLTLIGPRLFCGYVCPVGVLQELVHNLAGKLKIKKKSFGFGFAHSVRTGIFIMFVFLSVTKIVHVVFQKDTYAKSIYDYFNPFHGLEFNWAANLMDNLLHYLPLILVILVSLKLYRAFCHFICPIGLFTHWIEQISLFKISFKKGSCTKCNICLQQSPCTAIDEILKEPVLRPDCYACNICVESCPEEALEIGTRKTQKKSNDA